MHGLEAGTAVVVDRAWHTVNTTNNAVFGININGSSFTIVRATTVASTGNALGIQISTNGNAFIADPSATINASTISRTGLTVVSGRAGIVRRRDQRHPATAASACR